MPNRSTFYFAWCGSGESFSGSHMREDELIFAFELKHEEGQFAELELEVINPRVGLLAPGRPLWAWFSWHDGTTLHPLFYGRLIGIPDDLFEDIIKIRLVARPLDYTAQRRNLADGLKVLPYYDPIFIDESKLDDPDVALEGYSALWHVDRITHQVTVSDIINGEDGTVTFTQADAFYEGVSMKVAGAPLLLCEVEAEVSWTQCDHTGVYEMKSVPNLKTETVDAGATTSQLQGGGGVKIKPSEKEKPKAPKEELQTTYTWSYKNVTEGPHEDGDLMEESGSETVPFYGGDLVKQDKSVVYADQETGQGEEYSIKESYKYTYEYQPPTPESPPDSGGGGGGGGGDGGDDNANKTPDVNTAKKEVAVEVEQDRAEGMYVAMRADVQPILVDITEDQDDLVESLKLSTRDLVDAGVVSASAGTYWATGRGQQSVEYMLMVARAHLLAGSRVVEVEWECRMSRIIGLSCRKSAILWDERLPGGYALGKIVAYTMTGEGDNGELLGKVTINCSVGTGAPLPVMRSTGATIDGRAIIVEGTPVYVEVGYVDPGYQYYDGQMVTAVTEDVAYSPVQFQAVGLQPPVTEDQVLVRHEYHDGLANNEAVETLQTVNMALRNFTMPPIATQVTGPPPEMLEYSQLESAANQAIAQVYLDNPSWVEMEFKPTKGVLVRADYEAAVGELVMPKHIDFSATT